MVYTTFYIEGEVKTIVEAGTHCGTEALQLQQKYPEAFVLTYEADPDKWNRIHEKLLGTNVVFRKIGLGSKVEERMFYKFTGYENDGADSFFPRYNGDMSPKRKVKTTTLEFEMARYNLETIDLLCMDTQGFEYNILKGLGNRIKDVKNIILEMPDVRCTTTAFKIPDGQDSVYNGAKPSKVITEFLNKNGFQEVRRKQENLLEANVHFRKI
jgi:FkbM family methyltransferase